MLRRRQAARNRQRRILTKPLRHLEAYVTEDDRHRTPPSHWRSLHFLLVAIIFWYFELPQLATFSFALSISQRLGFTPKLVSFIKQRTNFNQLIATGNLQMRVYYYVDYWLSTFPYAKGVVLLSLTLALIFTSGTLISFMADEPWIESLWAAALGSGLDWGFINSKRGSLRFIAVCTNVGGLVVTALLLSLISDAVQTKYDSLRKGSSPVTESGHTLIIGWSLKALTVMEQLAKASESKGKDTIVVLTDEKEKADMEAEIASYDFNFGKLGTRVVCRSGSPLAFSELQRVSFSTARSIIILAGDRYDAERNDAKSLQILMNIVASLEREKLLVNDGHDSDKADIGYIQRDRKVVIEVMDSDNAPIMSSVCPGLVEPVMANDVVGRLMLQAARNPLVADVWQDLLGFDGCEPYATQWGILRGLKFKEVLLCFTDAIPLGIKTSEGEVRLNPDDSYKIRDGDEIIVLAEDDDSYYASISHTLIRNPLAKEPGKGTPFSKFRNARTHTVGGLGLEAIRRLANSPPREAAQLFCRFESGLDSNGPEFVEKILFCGWRFDMGALLHCFSAVAPRGSEFWILSEMDVDKRKKELKLQGFAETANNPKVKVVHRTGHCRRKDLDRLPLELFTGIIVGAQAANESTYFLNPDGNRSQNSGDSISDADARVVSAVMMIQDLIDRREKQMAKLYNPSYDCTYNALSRNDSDLSNKNNLPIGKSSGLSKCFRGDSQIMKRRSMSLGYCEDGRQILSRRCVIVGEIVDSRSQATLSVVKAIDAVVASNELVSKAIAMVSEDASVNKVLSNLFDPYGSEITLERVNAYVDVANNELVSFFELMIRGREYGTIVLGYLERDTDLDVEGNPESIPDTTVRYTEVVLNPSEKDLRRHWHPDDLLIVLMSMEPRDERHETVDDEDALELDLSITDAFDVDLDKWLNCPERNNAVGTTSEIDSQNQDTASRQNSFINPRSARGRLLRKDDSHSPRYRKQLSLTPPKPPSDRTRASAVYGLF